MRILVADDEPEMTMVLEALLKREHYAETEQYEAEDLSEYTDTELKQMYHRGEITRQEYEDETGEALE